MNWLGPKALRGLSGELLSDVSNCYRFDYSAPLVISWLDVTFGIFNILKLSMLAYYILLEI